MPGSGLCLSILDLKTAWSEYEMLDMKMTTVLYLNIDFKKEKA